jgi:hypothetical protein
MEAKALTIEDIDGKMTWIDVIRHYAPETTEQEAEYFLWNETCYPFDNETALKQIQNHFQSKQP